MTPFAPSRPSRRLIPLGRRLPKASLGLLGLLSMLALGGFFFLSHTTSAQQSTNPFPAAVTCAYNSSPPAATSGTFILVQCNSSGQLVLH